MTSEHFLYQIRFLFIFLCAIIFISNAQGQDSVKSGIIRGKISVISTDDVTGEIMRGRSLNRYGTHTMKDAGEFKPYSLSEKAVVYIENVPGSYDSPRTHPKLDQRDMVFRPLVLPILVGTTVDFPNSDPLFHNVFSFSQAKEFDLGRYPKGEKKSLKFDKLGVVSVYCEIHSYMFATILILQNPFFTLPDENGNYIISDVPPGTYQVSFWFGRKKIKTETVTVQSGQTVTLNFSY